MYNYMEGGPRQLYLPSIPYSLPRIDYVVLQGSDESKKVKEKEIRQY